LHKDKTGARFQQGAADRICGVKRDPIGNCILTDSESSDPKKNMPILTMRNMGIFILTTPLDLSRTKFGQKKVWRGLSLYHRAEDNILRAICLRPEASEDGVQVARQHGGDQWESGAGAPALQNLPASRTRHVNAKYRAVLSRPL
jgi:hypothetical protein